jgi:hypothetical protein
MPKKEKKIQGFEVQLKSIELLDGHLNCQTDANTLPAEFDFGIAIEHKMNASKKLIFVISKIEIKKHKTETVFGSITCSCIYEITNFEEVSKVGEDMKIHVPSHVIEILNSISISTVRGVMYSYFRGTFLHNVILPIIDPKQLQILK